MALYTLYDVFTKATSKIVMVEGKVVDFSADISVMELKQWSSAAWVDTAVYYPGVHIGNR